MAGIALTRLSEEYRNWRILHPRGFSARPSKNRDGTLNLMTWDCIIPGPEGTKWEGLSFHLKMYFTGNYPYVPPLCLFDPPIRHHNVDSCGSVSVSVLNDWKPHFSITTILLGIQRIFFELDPDDPESQNFTPFYLHW